MKVALLLLLVSIIGCNLSDDEEPKSNTNNVDEPSENCVTYCENAEARCRDANALYENETECLEACEGFPDDPDLPVASAITGDTVQCRLYHLDSAEIDPDTHCSHSSADSLPGKCVDEITACDRYCGIIIENCPAQFPSINNCLGACGVIPRDGMANEEVGDTVQCRITYANRAIGDSDQCLNASVDMSPICVD